MLPRWVAAPAGPLCSREVRKLQQILDCPVSGAITVQWSLYFLMNFRLFFHPNHDIFLLFLVCTSLTSGLVTVPCLWHCLAQAVLSPPHHHSYTSFCSRTPCNWFPFLIILKPQSFPSLTHLTAKLPIFHNISNFWYPHPKRGDIFRLIWLDLAGTVPST